MQANPLVEIVALASKRKWLRYTGRAVFETEKRYTNLPFEEHPQLRKMYDKLNANATIFHLEDAKAQIDSVTGNVIETLE